jgi:hypothetical protein
MLSLKTTDSGLVVAYDGRPAELQPPPTLRRAYLAQMWQEHSRDDLMRRIEREGAVFLSMLWVEWDEVNQPSAGKWLITYVHTEILDYEELC